MGPVSKMKKMASAVVAIAGKAIKGRKGEQVVGEGGKREREGAQSATSDPQKKLHIFSLGGR